MRRDPRHMTYDEVVQEFDSLREEMGRTANRMVELSQSLYGRVRSTPSDEYTSRYVTFANSWTRLGQMVEGALHRTNGVMRLMDQIKREKVAASEKEEREKEAARRRPAPPTTDQPDLVELYGQEMVNYASR